MVNLTANAGLQNIQFSFDNSTILIDNATEISVRLSDNTIQDYTGNFIYNAAHQLVGGDWTGLDGILPNGNTYYSATNINVPVAVFEGFYLQNNGTGLMAYAFSGDDSIKGSAQNDVLFGFTGNDTITSGGGNDTIFGNQGNDSIIGGNGSSLLLGGQGDDTIHAGSGSSVVCGNLGNDIVFGDTGSSLLQGGQGNDTIHGGTGNDIISGGLGNDLLYSGAGSSTQFIFGNQNGNDTIAGFKASDNIDILIHANGNDITSFQTLLPHINNVVGNTVIDLGGGNNITILGIDPATLHAGDFIFV